MLNNLPGLKISNFQIIFSNSKKLFMVWSKRHVLGLNDFLIFFVKKDFSKGKIDSTLSGKVKDNDMLLAQIYINDIIFGVTNESFYEENFKLYAKVFEVSMTSELKFFLSL